MINDKLFDELFPIGYRLLSYKNELFIKNGKWKCIGMLGVTYYVFERIG